MIRAEISSRNKYWIPKHRYYELKHFCLQYKDWKKALLYLEEMPKWQNDVKTDNSDISDPTAKLAIKRAYFTKRIEMVEKAARDSDDAIGLYILIAVTNNKSFEYMKTNFNIPCERDMWYDRYRKFFYILHTSQN